MTDPPPPQAERGAGGRVSVAMATYNGAAWVGEQLASIAAQTRPPDELVVCDDRSADGTAGLVESFAAGAPFPVRLTVNDVNLGATKNFEKAIGLCAGEVIALADQDDVWLPHKLARLADALAGSPQAAMAFSDAEIVDEDLRPRGLRLWPCSYVGPRQLRRMRAGRTFELLLTHNVVTGAAMAFRSARRDLLLPIPAGWVHDGWIALLLSAVADVVALDEPLIRYRQHGRQQIGAKKPTLRGQYRHARTMGRDYFRRETANYAAALERLSAATGPPAPPERLAKLAAKVRHYRARLRMREVGRAARLPIILRELYAGRYFRYSINWKAIPQDIFL